MLFLGDVAYCPICGEKIYDEQFCSKHGDVSGLPIYKYTVWYKFFQTAKRQLLKLFRIIFKVDANGNLIFQWLYWLEVLSFPELNYFSLLLFSFVELKINNKQFIFITRSNKLPDYRKIINKFDYQFILKNEE